MGKDANFCGTCGGPRPIPGRAAGGAPMCCGVLCAGAFCGLCGEAPGGGGALATPVCCGKPCLSSFCGVCGKPPGGAPAPVPAPAPVAPPLPVPVASAVCAHCRGPLPPDTPAGIAACSIDCHTALHG